MTPQEPRQRDELVIKVLRHFFAALCSEECVAEAKRPFVSLTYFLGWTDQQMSMTADPASLCESLDVPTEIWELVREIINSGGYEKLLPVWFSICLGDRPKPTHNLARVIINCTLVWEDGKILPVQTFVDQLMLESGGHFTDGLIVSIMQKQLQTIQNLVMDKPLDTLHADATNYRGTTPEDPFEVMLGLLIKHGIPQLHAHLREPVMQYVRLAQGMIRPIIPAQVMARLTAQKQEWAKQNSKLPEGGFDD